MNGVSERVNEEVIIIAILQVRNCVFSSSRNVSKITLLTCAHYIPQGPPREWISCPASLLNVLKTLSLGEASYSDCDG